MRLFRTKKATYFALAQMLLLVSYKGFSQLNEAEPDCNVILPRSMMALDATNICYEGNPAILFYFNDRYIIRMKFKAKQISPKYGSDCFMYFCSAVKEMLDSKTFEEKTKMIKTYEIEPCKKAKVPDSTSTEKPKVAPPVQQNQSSPVLPNLNSKTAR